MVNQAKLTKIAETWQRIASLKRTRINNMKIESRISSGKFVIYTNDHKRFAIPLEYINNTIIKRLFDMSEQVFGLPSEGPIRLLCDAVFVEYVVSLIKRGLAKDIEEAFLKSMETSCCSFNADGQSGQRCRVYAY